MKIISINPATEEVNKEFETFSEDEVINICKCARKAFEKWKKLDIKERANYLIKLADILRKNKEKYGRLITIEMGKPIKQAIAEIEKCALAAEFYAESAEKMLQDEPIQTEAKKSFVTFEPLGVILSVMPWNFPFWQVFRFAIPALIAGNVSVLRHSNNVPMCALAIEEAFRFAGFPKDVFRTIIVDHALITELVSGDLIDGVSFTGSVNAGQKIGQVAGKNIKKSVLELGGSDPFIVLEDADLNFACEAAIESRAINSGQSCIAAKRFIVVKDVAEPFLQKFIESAKSLKVGNPMDNETDIGPLASKRQIEILDSQVQDAIKKGAKIECGGTQINRKGYFYEPTVLSEIKKNMRIVKEEVFGPVAPVIIVKNEVEAIKIANSSKFGLGAGVWTTQQRGERIARQINAGIVFVNDIVKSDPHMPFGGIKKSGIGRELGTYGIKEFTNIKSIVVY